MNEKKDENTKKVETGSKKNIRGIIIVVILIIVVFKACGSGNCKERGCHDELYKDGYCRNHYILHVAHEMTDEWLNPDYGK